jgi:hypothetical protein
LTTVLIANAGSSSLKLSLLDPADVVLAATTVERWDGAADTGGIEKFLAALPSAPDAVGHRVVHGGAELVEPTSSTTTSSAGSRQSRRWRRCTSRVHSAPSRPYARASAVGAARRVLRHRVHATMPDFALT